MTSPKGKVEFRVDRCKGCGLCIAQCPAKTLGFSENLNAKGVKYAQNLNNVCIGCGICALVCPDAVITVHKAKKQA